MVTRCAATRNAAVDRCVVADHCAVADRSAAVDHCAAVGRFAEVDHYVVAGRDAAADRFVELALHIVAFHDVVLVGIRVALNVARSVAPNAVRTFLWGDFRSEAPTVAPVAVRLLAQIAALVVIPETTQA